MIIIIIIIIKPFIPKLGKGRVAGWRVMPPPPNNIKRNHKSCPNSKVNTNHAKLRSNKCCCKSFLTTAKNLAFKIDISIVSQMSGTW